mgnify:CR=1 FL=1
MKKKGLALVLALALMVVSAVAGTLAWLTANSQTVVNTFTTSNITVKLEETTGENYQMIPGYTITKDPKATVLTGSEDCFLFVKLDKSDNFDTFLTYTMADGWTELTGDGITGKVYYRTVEGNQIGETYSVLANDQVTVNGTVTKEQMNDMDAGKIAKPTLTITAYASQLHKSATEDFDAATAWDNIGTK